MIEFWAVLGLLSFLWTVKVAESEEKFARIFLLTVLWIITHYTILVILRSVEDISCFRWIKNIQKDAKSTKDVKLTNLARLIRSQLYCIFSTVAGLYIIRDFSDWPHDLLHLWKPHYEIIFEISASQWIWSLAEDMLCGEQVVAHMIIPPGQERDLYENFSQGLFYHHLFTIFAFSWSLCTHKLSGLCAFGLLFEAPVLLMNMRDIFGTFHHELQGFPYNSIWCRCFGGMGFQLYAIFVGVLFIVVRGGACSLWPVSLVIWRSQLSTLSIGSQIVYHLLGIAFCYVNTVVFFTYVIRYLMEDLVRMKALSLQSFYKTIGWTETQETVTASSSNPIDIESAVTSESAQGPSNSAANTTPATSVEAVKFIIAGQIYDVTSFLDSHPGGRDVLLMAANSGTRQGDSTIIADATEAFNEVGHSQHARNMMKRFLISEREVHSLTTAVPATPTIRPDDPGEDDENCVEIFKHPYRIGFDYSSVPSTQALFVVAMVIFAVFFLAAGFRNRKSIGYSHLRSVSDYSEHFAVSVIRRRTILPAFDALVGFLTVAATLSSVDRQVLAVLIGPIKDDLGLNDSQMGLIGGVAFSLLYSLGTIPAAWIADQRSRRMVITTGIAFWSAMTAACGMTHQFVSLFLARMGVGLGEAALGPAAYSTKAVARATENLPPNCALAASAERLAASFAIAPVSAAGCGTAGDRKDRHAAVAAGRIAPAEAFDADLHRSIPGMDQRAGAGLEQRQAQRVGAGGIGGADDVAVDREGAGLLAKVLEHGRVGLGGFVADQATATALVVILGHERHAAKAALLPADRRQCRTRYRQDHGRRSRQRAS
eukprot:gene26054-34054_t